MPKVKFKFDLKTTMKKFEGRLDGLLKSEIAIITERVRLAVGEAARTVFLEMGLPRGLVFDRQTSPPGSIGVHWSSLTRAYRAEKAGLSKSKAAGAFLPNRYFFYGKTAGQGSQLFADVLNLNVAATLGEATVTSSLLRERVIKDGQVANYKISIDPYPQFSRVGNRAGAVESLLFPGDTNRNLEKLMNRSLTAPDSYRPFVGAFIGWYIRTRIQSAAMRALKS